MNEKNNTLNGIHNRIQTAAAKVVQEKDTLTSLAIRRILMKAITIQPTELAVFEMCIEGPGQDGFFELVGRNGSIRVGGFQVCQDTALGIIEQEGKQLLEEEE